MGQKGNQRVGGVALLIRERIAAVLREDSLDGSFNEAIWVEFRNKKGDMTKFEVCYKPPNSAQEIEEQLCENM